MRGGGLAAGAEREFAPAAPIGDLLAAPQLHRSRTCGVYAFCANLNVIGGAGVCVGVLSLP